MATSRLHLYRAGCVRCSSDRRPRRIFAAASAQVDQEFLDELSLSLTSLFRE